VSLPSDAQPVWPFPSPDTAQSFLSSQHARVSIDYYRRGSDQRLYARARFGPDAQGPPGHVHGGAMAAVLDEAMGGVSWMNEHKVLAARIGINFLAPLPLDQETFVEAWIEKIDGRKVSTRASLRDATGKPVAEADGLFIVVKDDYLTAR
jgi:acyl-coenzyme A thioesterase PaaI-like protein